MTSSASPVEAVAPARPDGVVRSNPNERVEETGGVRLEPAARRENEDAAFGDDRTHEDGLGPRGGVSPWTPRTDRETIQA